ncbi:MAG: DUF4097 family beta strand repeat-containing protein [Acidobacteriota bacterium]
MSSMPPNPGGYPPYDPKTQWRAYQEQQKAAWRAQRDAWKAQRQAWRASHWGDYGPHAPSMVGPLILVTIGVVWLLIYSGRISGPQFWSWYAHWWPVLLIAAGLALLGEWALDMRRATPVRRSSGFVGILVFLGLLGLFAAGWNHMGPFMGWNGDNSFFNFGMPEHDFDQPALEQAIPADASIEIENPRGDVSVVAADVKSIGVQPHEVAYANSDAEAQKIFDAERTQLNVSGGTVQVKADEHDRGRVNLTITVPETAHVMIAANRGDVTAAGLNGGVNITASHGDTRLNGINGPVTVHLANGRHDLSAHQVKGDLTTDGNCNDLTLSEIQGSVGVNGEIFGDVHLENIAGAVKIRTSVTDVELASLPGDLTLDSDDLRVNQATGAVHVTTHAKDVDLNQIYGDSYVENRDGSVSVELAGSYGVDIRNSKGDVELALPPDVSATVDGRTHNGDIVTDYALTVSGDQDKTVTGKIGSGKARIVLSADNGDLRIKKGQAFPLTPPAPSPTGALPAPPASPSPNQRHFRPSKARPAQPVAQ